ncbi:hypothetical protein WICPIJ_004892 [Wickerhamomyces pijperi]|uniref:Uncharacterized protein n=1 Tax=Wickerhamomyces pijperi TaxID=599730 RepID=A0A9P8Q6V1_WICPI|nr:hypothetical protein WICPIJ_004892 [Wickerhamomyces pijperi]
MLLLVVSGEERLESRGRSKSCTDIRFDVVDVWLIFKCVVMDNFKSTSVFKGVCGALLNVSRQLWWYHYQGLIVVTKLQYCLTWVKTSSSARRPIKLKDKTVETILLAASKLESMKFFTLKVEMMTKDMENMTPPSKPEIILRIELLISETYLLSVILYIRNWNESVGGWMFRLIMI